jgi:hypothetical protein
MSHHSPLPETKSTRLVSDLSIHESICDMPRLAKDDPRYSAMRATWQESGIIPPLFITSRDEIVNGRHRYWYAVDNRMLELPVMVIPDEQISTAVLAGITGQNHNTVGQRAFFAVPFLKDAFQAAQERRLTFLATGGRAKLPPLPTAEDLAARFGFSKALLTQARQLHKEFAKDPALRDEWQPRILDPENPIGLGAALAGIAGKAATAGKARRATRNTALHNWGVAWENVVSAANKGWARWNDEEKTEATEALNGQIIKLPDAALEATAAAARDELKARKKAASNTESGN